MPGWGIGLRHLDTRALPRACSAIVLIQWQVRQTACPFSAVSLPPSACGVMWSACVALPVHPVPLIWQRHLSRSMICLRMAGGNERRCPDHEPVSLIVGHLYAVCMSQQLGPPTNALAFAGYILGAVAMGLSVFLGWIGLFIGFVPAILAIVFGFVGINTANRMNGLRKRDAVWAVIMGFLALVIPWVRQALFGI